MVSSNEERWMDMASIARINLCAYRLIHGCIRLLLGLLAYVLDPTASTNGLWSEGGYQIVVDGDTNKQRTF